MRYSLPALPTALAGARAGEVIPCHRAKTKGVVEFAVNQQSGIGGDPGFMELGFQAAAKPSLRAPLLDSPDGLSMMAPRDPT